MEVVSIYCRVSASGSISQSGNFSGPRRVETSQGRTEWPWTNLSGHLPSVPITSQSLEDAYCWVHFAKIHFGI